MLALAPSDRSCVAVAKGRAVKIDLFATGVFEKDVAVALGDGVWVFVLVAVAWTVDVV